MIDIHSHILPGVDDGAQDSSESLEMARMAVQDGVRTMVATPHMMPDGPMANRRDIVIERLEKLRRALDGHGIPLEVLPGGEVYIGANVPAELERGDLLTCADRGAYVLMELPAGAIPSFAEQVLFECQVRNVVPIVAHPERNVRSPDDLKAFSEWVARGVRLQVNARSLLGESGSAVERAAREIIGRRMAHFVASDAHSPKRRPPGLSAARGVVERMAGRAYAELLFEKNPARAIAGESVEAWKPATPAKRGLFARLLKRSG